MSVALRLAGADERVVVERLAQLEAHDLSELTGELPDDSGRYAVPRLDRFFTETDHRARLIEDEGVPIGFCLVRPVEGAAFVHSFFVLRAVRRHGVGAQAARALVATHDGPWAIAFLERYDAAARFWRGVAARAVGDDWSEERRTQDDEVFGWITFDTSPRAAGSGGA